ncbi:hypothetical protein CEXT_813161 [Caerostris extrusa]|uniref:BTB domain-containing protein n=1 Tax=Caerostris extrusa TaxID=172846 RepID=A0AAV4R0S0_CAEEX|nr:hypothetical protein CEXT_813161 [Caerostris extrusa]
MMSAKTNKRREETSCAPYNKTWMLGLGNLQTIPANLPLQYSPPPSLVSPLPSPILKCSVSCSPSPASGSGSSTGGSSPGSTSDPNWQSNHASVRERNAAMFNNELMSDVHFLVGPKGSAQKIPAHKYVLATGSSVFYAMFFGGLAENDSEIEIPDVEPAAFLTLLRFLYCDDINLEADTVLSTLYVAKKYLVPHLARACVAYLETSLTAKNACVLLKGFADIDYRTLESILSRETLMIKEYTLFQAALNWSTAECIRQDIEPTIENKRRVLGNAMHLIRIPTMTLEEYANGAAQSGLLTLQETKDIFLHYTANNKPVLPFCTKPRVGLKTQVCHRFQSSAYRSNQWRYRGRCDSIQFSVDKRIFIVGFGLYGSSNGAADYTVKIELKRMGKVLAENKTNFYSDGSSNTFHVYFEHPILVEADTYYTASTVLDGAELSYFGQDGVSEMTVGCITFQFQCSSDSTNGTGVQGGQIPELIFYGPSQDS